MSGSAARADVKRTSILDAKIIDIVEPGVPVGPVQAIEPVDVGRTAYPSGYAEQPFIKELLMSQAVKNMFARALEGSVEVLDAVERDVRAAHGVVLGMMDAKKSVSVGGGEIECEGEGVGGGGSVEESLS